jgi:hypothetical protein
MPGISAKMSFLPGAKVDKGPPKLKVQTLSFHPKIEHNSLPVKVSETNRILAITNAELADALEVGDRIAAVDGVDLVGPLEYSNICNDKRSCEVTVERMEGGRDSERGRLTDGEELEVQMTRINGTFGAEMNMFGRITNVAPGGAAEKAGLKAWDRIKTVDDTLVFNTKDMGQFFASKDTVTVFAMRPPHDRAWCRPRPAFPGLSGSRRVTFHGVRPPVSGARQLPRTRTRRKARGNPTPRRLRSGAADSLTHYVYGDAPRFC